MFVRAQKNKIRGVYSIPPSKQNFNTKENLSKQNTTPIVINYVNYNNSKNFEEEREKQFKEKRSKLNISTKEMLRFRKEQLAVGLLDRNVCNDGNLHKAKEEKTISRGRNQRNFSEHLNLNSTYKINTKNLSSSKPLNIEKSNRIHVKAFKTLSTSSSKKEKENNIINSYLKLENSDQTLYENHGREINKINKHTTVGDEKKKQENYESEQEDKKSSLKSKTSHGGMRLVRKIKSLSNEHELGDLGQFILKSSSRQNSHKQKKIRKDGEHSLPNQASKNVNASSQPYSTLAPLLDFEEKASISRPMKKGKNHKEKHRIEVEEQTEEYTENISCHQNSRERNLVIKSHNDKYMLTENEAGRKEKDKVSMKNNCRHEYSIGEKEILRGIHYNRIKSKKVKTKSKSRFIKLKKSKWKSDNFLSVDESIVTNGQVPELSRINSLNSSSENLGQAIYENIDFHKYKSTETISTTYQINKIAKKYKYVSNSKFKSEDTKRNMGSLGSNESDGRVEVNSLINSEEDTESLSGHYSLHSHQNKAIYVDSDSNSELEIMSEIILDSPKSLKDQNQMKVSNTANKFTRQVQKRKVSPTKRKTDKPTLGRRCKSQDYLQLNVGSDEFSKNLLESILLARLREVSWT